MSEAQSWYIVKQPEGVCTIIPFQEEDTPKETDSWGPFASREEAIARRIGLIRAGKCQPQ